MSTVEAQSAYPDSIAVTWEGNGQNTGNGKEMVRRQRHEENEGEVKKSGGMKGRDRWQGPKLGHDLTTGNRRGMGCV